MPILSRTFGKLSHKRRNAFLRCRRLRYVLLRGISQQLAVAATRFLVFSIFLMTEEVDVSHRLHNFSHREAERNGKSRPKLGQNRLQIHRIHDPRPRISDIGLDLERCGKMFGKMRQKRRSSG